jgi:hypothetical protein
MKHGLITYWLKERINLQQPIVSMIWFAAPLSWHEDTCKIYTETSGEGEQFIVTQSKLSASYRYA